MSISKCIERQLISLPRQIAPAVDRLPSGRPATKGYEHIFIGYADCGHRRDLDKSARDPWRRAYRRTALPFHFTWATRHFRGPRGDDHDDERFSSPIFLPRHFEASWIRRRLDRFSRVFARIAIFWPL